MTAKRALLAAMATAMLGIMAGAGPASAQYGGGGYYDDGGDYRPRRYERRYEDEDYRPRPRPYGRQGSICVTKRGNCPHPLLPPNSPCRCDIPGFGLKRGAIDPTF